MNDIERMLDGYSKTFNDFTIEKYENVLSNIDADKLSVIYNEAYDFTIFLIKEYYKMVHKKSGSAHVTAPDILVGENTVVIELYAHNGAPGIDYALPTLLLALYTWVNKNDLLKANCSIDESDILTLAQYFTKHFKDILIFEAKGIANNNGHEYMHHTVYFNPDENKQGGIFNPPQLAKIATDYIDRKDILALFNDSFLVAFSMIHNFNSDDDSGKIVKEVMVDNYISIDIPTELPKYTRVLVYKAVKDNVVDLISGYVKFRFGDTDFDQIISEYLIRTFFEIYSPSILLNCTIFEEV